MEQTIVIRRRPKKLLVPEEKKPLVLEEKKTLQPHAKISLTIKMSTLPEVPTQGKKKIKIPVRTKELGNMQMHVVSKTYNKARETILKFTDDEDYLVLISVSSDGLIENKGGVIVCKGCALQVVKKKKKENKETKDSLN